ncbi:lysophospholipid acyltransferase family protein [bacterium]|nr:lysophospholipid acyltransferase family protein [bacterium]
MRIVIAIFTWIFTRPSWERSEIWGERIGRLMWRVGIRKRVVMDNLHLVFASDTTPEGHRKDDAELAAICRAVYENLGRLIVLYFRTDLMDAAFFRDRFEAEGMEHLRDGIARGRGVLGIGMHFGILDIAMGKAAHELDAPITLVGKNIKNPVVNNWFIESRRRMRFDTVGPKDTRQEILTRLGRNELVTMVLDQSMRERYAIYVNVMGRLTATNKSAAGLARDSGATVVPGWAYRVGPARYRLVAQPPIPYITHDDPDEERRLNTQAYVERLDAAILENPEHWFWLHRRWKRVKEIEDRKSKIED